MACIKRIKKKIIQNLEDIFKQAMEKQNLSAAIQAQNAIAKTQCMFAKEEEKKEKELSLEDLSEEQIKNLIKQSQKRLNK